MNGICVILSICFQVEWAKRGWRVRELSLVFISNTSASTHASNQVKTKFDSNTSKSKIIQTFRYQNLFRREVVWIQWFHWPNIPTCGKCWCWVVFRFHSLQRQRKHERKHKKMETFWSLCLCLCLRQGRFHGELRIIIVFALVPCACGCVASETDVIAVMLDDHK